MRTVVLQCQGLLLIDLAAALAGCMLLPGRDPSATHALDDDARQGTVNLLDKYFGMTSP